MNMQKKIVIINQHSGNYGDEAAGTAAMEQLRVHFPSANFRVVYNTQHLVNDPEVPTFGLGVTHYTSGKPTPADFFVLLASYILSLDICKKWLSLYSQKLLEVIADADVIFVAPGGANIGIYHDWRYLIRILLAIRMRKRPIFFLNTLGPSGDWRFDLVSMWLLRRSKVFVRERASELQLAKRGVSSSLGVDVAFSLPSIGRESCSQELVLIVSELGRFFRKHRGFDQLRFENEICDGLLEEPSIEGRVIRLLPNSYGDLGEMPYLRHFREVLLKKLQGKCSVLVDEPYSTYRGYEERIARAALVVSMRYHGVVLAALHGVPYVSISYENKMCEVAQYTGCRNSNIRISEWQAAKFASVLRYVVRNSASIRAELEARKGFLAELARLPSAYAWLLHERK